MSVPPNGGSVDPAQALFRARAAEQDLDVDGSRIQSSLRSKLFGVRTDPVKIGRYVLLGMLGTGGMGVVYAARDEELGRKVALKLIHEAGDGAAERQARLLSEAQALARLSHPNVVQIYEVGALEGRVFIAMEFLPGPTLGAWLSEEARSWRAAIDKYLQAGEGLAAAHAQGIVHRDFKPANLLLGGEGRLRVVDFGLAGTLRSLSMAETEDLAEDDFLLTVSRLAGTPAYMSPEQVRRIGVDARSDQYSFCVALYEALFGRRPHEGRSSTAVLSEIQRGRVTSPPRGTHVPAHICHAIMRGLSRDPDHRFPDMHALLAELRRDPWARRRWVFAASGLLAVGGVALWPTAEPSLCGGAGAAVEATWNVSLRDEVHAAFLATRVKYAARAWDEVKLQLDAWTQAWRTQRHEACVAHQVQLTQSAELHDLRVACLGRARGDVEALVAALRVADSQVVSNAAVAVGDLPDLARCGAGERLHARGAAPADPRVAQVEDALAAAAAQFQVGRLEEAVERATEAVTVAEALNYRPLLAEALRGRANTLRRASRYPDALVDLDRAVDVAESSGDDELVLDLWLRLAWVAARENAGERAQWAIRRAAAALVRTGGDELARARLELARAQHARWAKDFEAAVPLAREAVDRFSRLLGATASLSLQAQSDLGAILGEAGQFAAAQATFEASRDARRRLLGPTHPELASDQYNIARTLFALGRYGESRAEVEAGLALLPPNRGRVDITRINLRLQLVQLAMTEDNTKARDEQILLGYALVADLPTSDWRWILLTEWRADLYASDDEPELALALSEALLEAYGDEGEGASVNYWRVRTEIALALEALDRPLEARDKYRRLLSDAPSSGGPKVQMRRKTWSEAIARIDAIPRVDSANP